MSAKLNYKLAYSSHAGYQKYPLSYKESCLFRTG